MQTYQATPPAAALSRTFSANSSALIFIALTFAPVASAQTETVLHNFIARTGDAPFGGRLAADSSGNLYGATYEGGSASAGVVFQLDKNGYYSVLHNFSDSSQDGGFPYSSVVRDAAGNIYGTTAYGGGSGFGVVYKLDSANEFSILHSFTGDEDGAYPDATLTVDAAGNLYGTAVSGGGKNFGVVFKLDSTGQFSLLHTFTAESDGAYPYSGVTFDAAGNLYGTTEYGGAGKKGTVYKIDPHGQETILHSFSGGADGGVLYGGVIADAAGNIYGTAYYGGAFDYGVVFKLDPGGLETVLHSFAGGSDGANSEVTLAVDDAGNFYGATDHGGTPGNGVIFKIDRATQAESVVFSFSGTDGGPYANGPLLLLNSNIYGTTYEGGQSAEGVIYKLTLAP